MKWIAKQIGELVEEPFHEDVPIKTSDKKMYFLLRECWQELRTDIRPGGNLSSLESFQRQCLLGTMSLLDSCPLGLVAPWNDVSLGLMSPRNLGNLESCLPD